MQHLMDLDYGWDNLNDAFILKVVQILSSPQSLINVCRPATAILKRLVEADPMSAPGPLVASSSRNPPALSPGSVYRYGFDVVFDQMKQEPGLLETVVSRLGSADTALALYRSVTLIEPRSVVYHDIGCDYSLLILITVSMMLINSLLAHATDTWWEEFIEKLERLNTRRAVIVSVASLSLFSTYLK